MPEVAVRALLSSPTVTVREICCQGRCRRQGEEECAAATALVFPYRGVYARHLGRDQAIAEPTQVLFFNAEEGYRISHPVEGGDACLSLGVDESLLLELTPKPLLRDGASAAFRQQRLPIDGEAQILVALARRRLKRGDAEPLEAESLALALIRRALGSPGLPSGASVGRRRLVDRAKLVLASDPARRWTLAHIAAQVGGSPVYLTQVFRQAEGVSLYRYQMGLRLSRALPLLTEYDDLTTLGLDLGFSSHSHFSAAFRKAYGQSPSAFRGSAV